MNNTIRIVVLKLVILCNFIVVIDLFLSSRSILRLRKITTALSCDFQNFRIASQSPVSIYGENACRYHVDIYRQISLPPKNGFLLAPLLPHFASGNKQHCVFFNGNVPKRRY